MYTNLPIYTLVCLIGFCLNTLTADAQEKVSGPWMWIITPDSEGCGADATHVDEIKAQTDGKLTEKDVAKEGITPKVLKVKFKNELEWTEGIIIQRGENNINEAVAEIGLTERSLDNHCAYAVINAKSQKPVKGANVRVGSDDSIKVWINGKEVHANAVNRRAEDFQDDFTADIKSGNNVIMVKVCDCVGEWKMFFGIQAQLEYNLDFRGLPVEPADKLAIQWAVIKVSY